MKKVWVLLLGALVVSPAFADEVTDEDVEAPAEEAVAEDVPPAEEAPVEEAPAEEVAAEEAPAEEPAEEAPVEEDEPFYLYGGIDYVDLEASFSSDALKASFGGETFGSQFYRARVGTRVFEVVGLEAHFGQADSDGTDPGEVEVDSYWGVYAVPTGTFLDIVEISAPVGFSAMTLTRGAAEIEFNRLAYGLNVEFPLRAFAEGLPDLRFGGGGMVYQAENHARTYGFHFGVRLDLAL